MNGLRIGLVFALAAAANLALPASLAAQYTIIDLGTLGGGGVGGEGRDINNLGQIVGLARVADGSARPFLITPSMGAWFAADSGGTNSLMQNLGTLGRDGGSARSINDAGRVVGLVSSGTSQAFIWDAAGGMRILPVPATAECYAQKISNSGDITGDTFNPGRHAFAGSEAQGFKDISVDIGGGTSIGLGVNSLSQYVGAWFPVPLSGVQKPYLWKNNVRIDLGFLTGTDQIALAFAISDHQIVVGGSGPDGATLSAFVLVPRDLDGDGVLDFNDADADPKNELMVKISGNLPGSSQARDINEHGHVLFWNRPGPSGSAVRCYLVKPADANGDGTPDTWFIDDGAGKNLLAEEIPATPGCSFDTFQNLRALNNHDMIVGSQVCGTQTRAVLVLPPGFRFAPADLDRNMVVDARDLGLFTACSTGPNIPYDPAGCTLTPGATGYLPADFDSDGDVDMDDFGVLQRCYSGPDISADPECAD